MQVNHMYTLAYPANIDPDETGSYLVTFPDFAWGATEGTTVEEALIEAEDALAEILAAHIINGEPIPRPSVPRNDQHLVYPPAEMAAKTALYLALQESGIPKTELAARLAVSEKAVRRLLDPHHKSKLEKIDAALHVLGKRFAFNVADDQTAAPAA